MTIKRAWKLDPEPYHNQEQKLVVLGTGGLSPVATRGLQEGLDDGRFSVAIDNVTGDVEDINRNVITQADLAYRVIGDGNDVYLVEV